MKNIKLSHQAPLLPVHDMNMTIDFYQQKLGFPKVWKWDDPTTVASVSRDDLTLLFTWDPSKTFQSTGMEIMIFLSGVSELYEEYKSNDVSFADPLEQKPWGLWEFSILDINGYYLRFAERSE